MSLTFLKAKNKISPITKAKPEATPKISRFEYQYLISDVCRRVFGSATEDAGMKI